MLKPRQRLDKYRIERMIASGSVSDVYQAYDTVEGIRVALKIPQFRLLRKEEVGSVAQEVRLAAKLDHPNVLPIKNANFIDGLFVIAYPLGSSDLADRLRSRLSSKKALHYAGQIIEALAYAHSKRIIHCDVKPENLIMFPENRLRLTDFGLAKITVRTLRGSGSGTIGYLAPEQAMGRPSPRSDVFSAGLVIYRMLTGVLPEWPYEWPLPNYGRLRSKVHPDLINFLQRAVQVRAKDRFSDGCQMLTAFRRLRQRGKQVRSKKPADRSNWREYRIKEYGRRYGKLIGNGHTCNRCQGPLSELMKACPWCGHGTKVYRGSTVFAVRCRRCGHGMKREWKYCPMCYGGTQGPFSERVYSDRRYTATCHACRGPLMSFMRYCPWCRRRVKQGWKIQGSKEKCSCCGWGVLRDYWEYCPWCTKSLLKHR